MFVNNDDAAGTLAALRDAGIAIAALVDPRPEISAPLRRLRQGLRCCRCSQVRSSAGRSGGLGVSGVEIVPATGRLVKLDCDLLVMSGGWNPALQLTSHLDGKPVWDERIAAFVPGALPPGMQSGGRGRGRFCNAGYPAAVAGAGAIGKAFVDFQNDVTATDVKLAKQEGFSSVEHLKRYTTLGMATDQGKMANVNGLGLMAEITGKIDRANRHHALPPALHAGGAWRAGGPHRGQAFQARAGLRRRITGRRRRAPFLSRPGMWLRAQYFPQAGRGLAGRDRHPRGEHRAPAVGILRCHDAGQDRYPGHGRGEISGMRLHQ